MEALQDQVSSAKSVINHLVAAWCYECGMPRLPWCARYFGQCLDNGLTPQLLEELISTTARAARPSFAYLDFLVRMCDYSGIKDQSDWWLKPHLRPELPM